MTIHDADGHLRYFAVEPYSNWVPVLPSDVQGPFRYRIHVRATTTSGHMLEGSTFLQVITDLGAHCFNPVIPPVTGEMFDPRICGVTYPYRDAICLQ